ncbi:hypothetical protein PENSPDRAFT_668813 [Peniophora sp. CONT]|nr:hypothetical protein PENSPDRAFT_668813 [Peniophora sp. CONT]
MSLVAQFLTVKREHKGVSHPSLLSLLQMDSLLSSYPHWKLTICRRLFLMMEEMQAEESATWALKPVSPSNPSNMQFTTFLPIVFATTACAIIVSCEAKYDSGDLSLFNTSSWWKETQYRYMKTPKKPRKMRKAPNPRLLRQTSIKDLDAAWDIYFAVIKRVEEPLHQLTTLDSQYGYN